MPAIFVSHSSKDAEALRLQLVTRGRNREGIFLDHSMEGMAAHERWKDSRAALAGRDPAGALAEKPESAA